MSDTPLSARLQPIRLLAMDVDGVLTDGGITLGQAASGETIELKTFSARDGLGIGLVLAAAMHVAWVTGRRSAIVEARARELGVKEVCQGARDKRRVLRSVAARLGLETRQVLYVGDDLNDLPAFEAAGVAVAVSDAAIEVRRAADWVTEAPGGRGAIRETAERILREQGRWDEALAAFLGRLRAEQDRLAGQ